MVLWFKGFDQFVAGTLVWQGFRDWVPQEEEEEKKRGAEDFAGEGEEEENTGPQEGKKHTSLPDTYRSCLVSIL